jgi:protein SCO1/2
MKNIFNSLYHTFSQKANFKIILILISLMVPVVSPAQAVNDSLAELRAIDVEEHSGEIIPLDLQFRNEEGDTVTLGQYFSQGRPVILILAYYECPMLCTLVLNGITQSVYNMDLELGKDYNMITVSIDPTETPELAAAKKRTHLRMLEQETNTEGWHFLVGDQKNIKSLADAIGFKYYYVEDRDEFAHPTIVTLLTDKGKISRYLYGIEYKPFDVKLGLLEAAKGNVGSTVDRIILYCYHYDPDAKGYTVVAANVMTIGGAITLVLLFIFLGLLWIKDIRKRKLNIAKN